MCTGLLSPAFPACPRNPCLYLIPVTSNHQCMSLHIAFEKSADSLVKQIVKTLAGPYVHTELIVSHATAIPLHTAYAAYMKETFTQITQNDFWYEDQSHDFLRIPVSCDELRRIDETCEACVKTKVPYNTRDMILSIIPLRSPTEKDIYHAKSLFCSQSIVLVLRSCLDQNHPLQPSLASVNSRTITPTQLYDLIRPYSTPACKSQMMMGACSSDY